MDGWTTEIPSKDFSVDHPNLVKKKKKKKP